MQRVDLDKNQILTLYNAIPEESDEEMKKYVNLSICIIDEIHKINN